MEEVAYYFVCEGLSNVLKHASSTHTAVRLSQAHGRLLLEVSDNGVGFAPDCVSGSGLMGLRDRLDAVGGSLQIVSKTKGTTLLAELPARPRGAHVV